MKYSIGRVALVLAGIAVIGLLVGGSLLAGSHGFSLDPRRQGVMIIDDDRTVSARAIGSVDIETISTDIRWHSAAGDQLRVHLHGSTNRKDNPPELFITQDGERLEIGVRPKRTIGFIGWDLTRAQLDIYVPADVARSISLRTVSGDIEIDDLQAKELRIKTVSGDLAAADTSAESTWFTTISGDFTVEGVLGDLNYASVSGKLDLRLRKYADDLALKSTSGQIMLDLPDGSLFTLEANSISGKISCAFPVTISGGHDRRRLVGSVGDSPNRVGIETVSGSVRIF